MRIFKAVQHLIMLAGAMFALCLSVCAEAQTSLSLPDEKTLAPLSSFQPDATLKKNYHLLFRMRQTEYLAEPPSESQPARVYSFTGRLQLEDKVKSFKYESDLKVISAERESERPYLSVPNMYVGWESLDQSLRFYIGRKTENWSRLDDQWKLGVWQPMARWDYIHPESLGLTGVFFNWESSVARLRLFATPYFLPDQGPNFELKDGTFTSNNRWFWSPQSQIGVLSQPSNFYFDLNRPSEEDVIHHGSYAASLGLGKEDDGWWTQVSYSHKPQNQLHLGIDGQLQIFKEGRTYVTIHPEVVYHNVTTGEMGWSSEDFSFFGSITHDRPEDPHFPNHWVQSELKEIMIYGGVASHNLNFIGIKNSLIRYSYMQIEELENLANPTLLGDSVDSSLDRFMFERVFSTEWAHRVFLTRKYIVHYGVKYMYSIPDEAGLLSLKTELLAGRNLTFDLSLDILGANASADDAGTGLMSRYRTNDRLALGVSYAF